MYFQSMLSLYHSFADEKKPVVISQLNEYQMPEEFFHFLLEKMEPSNLAASLSKTIMDISIDYVNSLGPNVSIKNVKQFVQYLLKLISLKTQPTSYEKYTSFLQIAFRMASQHNHESIYNQIIKYPHEQSVIPISVLCQTNPQFSNGALQILVNTFPNFKRDQNLVIWMVACTNLFEKCQYDGSDDKPIRASIDTALLDKFIPITRKIHLLESSLHFLPSKTGDELIASHVVNLLSCISIASTIDEVALSLNLAKKVLMRMKQNPITQITPDKIISSVFSYILPAYRTGKSINASLLDFCNEIDSETLQARISNSIKTNDITLSTLFLISRFPTPETIPYLLAKARVDQKSQYVAIFYFLSHNLVPFRYLPRLFEILAPSDLHFLNEIFEQKPQLYCTAALKFLASCRVVEKIEYISCLFAQAKTLPVIKSTYARGAFLSVACHRALSKMPGCPIRLLLDYIHRCIIATYTNEPNEDEETPDELSQSKENNTETSNSNETTENSHVDDNENQIENEEKKIEPNAEVPADDEENENENNKDNNNEKKNGKDNNEDDIETAQVKTSASAALSLSLGQTDPLDLISDDIASLSLPPVSLYDVMKAMGILNRPTFCQSQAIRDWCSADSETKQILIDMALEQVKSGNTVFTIIIGSLSDDPILIHNCVQTLAQCDLFLLAFFFTTAASCNPQLVLKELKDYVTKEPEAAPQSFVTRLFTSRPSTMPRRQRIARRCIIGMAPFVPFSQYLYDTLMASMPNADESANSPLTCESIIAVCSRLTHKEVLHSLIDRLVSRSDAFLDQPLFVPAIIHVLNANQTLTESDALSVIKLWIKLLINHKALVENITDFEKTLLASKSAINSFLKEMEHAIRAHGDNPLLFSSLKRAILVIPNFDLSKKASLITLVISNCLSENDATLEFCISLLRQTYRVTSSVSSLQGTFIFSHDYTEAVRPFLTELASKFPSNTLVQLVEALLLYYQENPTKHQASTCLFTYFSVIKEPSTFIKAKFIPKLSAACDKMTRNTDYAAMLYMFRVLDALNAADHTLFFNEFIRTPENEFIALYTERYARHSESLGALLIPRIIELKNIDEKWKDFMIFDRIIKLFGGFIKSYVRDTTAPDRITGIIFALLIQISTANMLRKRGIKIDSYLYIFEISLSELRSSTGIDLISGSRLVLQNDNDFYELMNAFSHSFQYLQHEVTDLLLTSLNSLVPTKHCDTSLICTSSFLANVSHAHSEQCKKMKARAVDLFTTIMKKCQFETSLIGFIIAKSPSAFSANTLRQLNAEALTQFLSLSIESVNKSHDAVPPLELLLGIIRSSSGPFIGVHVQEIIDTLRNAVSANKVKIDSILVLNIIGELGRRKQVPTSLLKDSSVSFRSLAPLLLSNDQEINTRVTAIFSLMIFGSTDDNPDFELIFSSLMSLYVGYEKDSGHYVAIANDMLKYVTQVNKRVLDLLSHIFSPILSVGDSACNVAINEFLKFLRKQATSQDEELSTFAIHLMTVFAKPKRNIPVSSK